MSFHSKWVITLCIPDLARTWGESNTVNKLFCFFLFSRQKLIIPNGSCPIILNTYFCEKIVAKEDSKIIHEVHSWDTPLPRRSITLAQMFKFKSLTIKSPKNQVSFHWFRGFMFCSNIGIERCKWRCLRSVSLQVFSKHICQNSFLLLLCLVRVWCSSVFSCDLSQCFI